MFFNRGDQAAISLLTGVLCTSRRGRVLIMFLIGRIALKQKAICFWQRRRGQTAKVLSGCGVLAVIWVIWMERNRTFKFIVVQRWKSFRRELSSGHIYIGLCFVGNLKITLFLLFCFKWDSSCSLGVFLLDWFGRNWVFQGDQQRNCSRTGTFIFPEMSESCQWAD